MQKSMIVKISIIFILILPLMNPILVKAGLTMNRVYQIKVYQIPLSSNNLESQTIELLTQNKYHNLSEVYKELEYFNQTAIDLIEYSSIGSSYQNNSIPLITLTNEQIPEELKAETYIVAAHHAREQITIEHSLRTIRDLVNEYINGTPEVVKLLDRTIIYFIITLNPDALDYAINNNSWHRKNMHPSDEDGDGSMDEDPSEDMNGDGRIYQNYTINRANQDDWFLTKEGIDNDNDGKLNEDAKGGVDLNRNYPFHWNDSNADSGSTGDKSEEDYPGEEPLSEKETQALVNFVQQHNFTHALSLHSGTNTTILGWGYTNDPQVEAPMYTKMITDFRNNGYLPESFFTQDNEIGYTTAGDWGDWTYATQKTISCTLEIYHLAGSENYYWIDSNDTHDVYQSTTIFEYFNPPSDRIEQLHQELYSFEKYWLSLTPSIINTKIEKVLDIPEKRISLYIRSGSKYFNTTDNTRIILTDVNGTVNSYPSIMGPLLIDADSKLNVFLKEEIPRSFIIDITLKSGWASGLSFRIEVTSSDFKKSPGFNDFLLIIGCLTLLRLVYKKLKKQ